MRALAPIILTGLLTGCVADRSANPDAGGVSEPPVSYQASMAAEEDASLASPPSESAKRAQRALAAERLEYVLRTMDRPVVLRDCRRLMRIYTSYQIIFETRTPGSPVPIYLIDPDDPRLPGSVAALQPSRIAVTDDRVELELGTPQHPLNLLAFAKDVAFEPSVEEMLEGQAMSREEMLTQAGFRKLTDGLWYATEWAEEDPDEP